METERDEMKQRLLAMQDRRPYQAETCFEPAPGGTALEASWPPHGTKVVIHATSRCNPSDIARLVMEEFKTLRRHLRLGAALCPEGEDAVERPGADVEGGKKEGASQ